MNLNLCERKRDREEGTVRWRNGDGRGGGAGATVEIPAIPTSLVIRCGANNLGRQGCSFDDNNNNNNNQTLLNCKNREWKKEEEEEEEIMVGRIQL